MKKLALVYVSASRVHSAFGGPTTPAVTDHFEGNGLESSLLSILRSASKQSLWLRIDDF
jgi:hypothetical protein